MAEESAIKFVFERVFWRYGLDGVYDELVKNHGYKRTPSGMYSGIKRMGLLKQPKNKPPRRNFGKFPELTKPGEKVQIDVKEVPRNCLRGSWKRDEKRLYQWTAIDECTRWRFVYGYEEHTPENSVDFLKRLIAAAPFKIQTIQTDNGVEFTYKYISDEIKCPFELALEEFKITHKLIPPRTPWHNGKVERSHRNDQRYFYDWETFPNLDVFNARLAKHLEWSNNKTMRVLGLISPKQRLEQLLEAA